MINLLYLSKWVKSAGQRLYLLKDINLEIAQGEFVSIMGPSGAGKSTLLNVVGMLDDWDEGHYYFNGEDVGA